MRVLLDTINSYVQRHPWQTIEHLVVLILLCTHLSNSPRGNSTPDLPPGNLDVFDSPEVHKAPPPTMDVTGLAPGHALHAGDARGDIFRLVLQAPQYVVNAYYTRAVRCHVVPRGCVDCHTSHQGFKRSGDLHNCTQYDVLLSGTASLTTHEVGTDVVRTYRPHQLIAIPPRVPHLFDFHTDSYLLEWYGAQCGWGRIISCVRPRWDCPFEAWCANSMMITCDDYT